MGEAETIAEISFNKDQLDDLAWLLAKTRNLGDIRRIGETFLNSDAVTKAANDVSKVQVFAMRIVQAMQDKNVVPAAVHSLMAEAHPSGEMAVGLRHILRGERLNTDDALQALVNEYEPFLSSEGMIELLQKVKGNVCAVALGKPYYKIRGSGILIAPDVVITNYHVIEPFLPKDPATGELKPQEPGDQIFFFFDYLTAPRPTVPPATTPGTIHVTAAADWYIYGRERLLDDGMPNAPDEVKNNELDYVLIRLARPIGSLQARTGGGLTRGWLPLEDFVDLEKAGKRILVVQHPEAMPQVLDIGDYEGLDKSKTRVRYSVSTAKGSSGGAAIGTDGRLVALHNAEVKDNGNHPLGARRVNQGVKIDCIMKDIGAKLPKTPVPAEDKRLLWSLNDDFLNSRPIIGRSKFRENFTLMSMSNSERVLVVRGTPPAGLKFSIKLLHRLRLPDIRVAEFSAIDLQKPIVEGFLPKLISDLNLEGGAAKWPDFVATETATRWVGDVAKWLLNVLAKDNDVNKMKYPAWIILNTVMPNDQSFAWPAYLEDLVAALLGRRNDQNIALDVPQLRWLLLATPQTNLPLAGIKSLEENLDGNLNESQKYLEEFEECYVNAYKSIDRQSQMTPGMFYPVARKVLRDNKNKDKPLPARKALAIGISELLNDTSGI